MSFFTLFLLWLGSRIAMLLDPAACLSRPIADDSGLTASSSGPLDSSPAR